MFRRRYQNQLRSAPKRGQISLVHRVRRSSEKRIFRTATNGVCFSKDFRREFLCFYHLSTRNNLTSVEPTTSDAVRVNDAMA